MRPLKNLGFVIMFFPFYWQCDRGKQWCGDYYWYYINVGPFAIGATWDRY